MTKIADDYAAINARLKEIAGSDDRDPKTSVFTAIGYELDALGISETNQAVARIFGESDASFRERILRAMKFTVPE